MNFGKGYWKTFQAGIEREWVVTNGIGGYAGGSITGANTRKHHGLLIASLRPPVLRHLILASLHETVTTDGHTCGFQAVQKPGGVYREGQRHLARFTYDLLPSFLYHARDVFVKKTVALEHGKNTVAVSYEITNGASSTQMTLTPLFNFRDHGACSTCGDLRFETSVSGGVITLIPESDRTVRIRLFTSHGVIEERDERYYTGMEYQTEIDTGMEAVDNHFAPYVIRLSLEPRSVTRLSLVCTLEDGFEPDAFASADAARRRISALAEHAGYHDRLADSLVRAADQFIVYRESTKGKTVLAGLPWFTDWGRDTMVALPGLTLSTKRFDDAREILQTFARYVKDGLVPNMFPDSGQEPFYNTADASLWYFHAVDLYLKYTGKKQDYAFIKDNIYGRLEEIIRAYTKGAGFSIKMDTDGLINAGSGLDQVTWMDVRVGDWVVTPRHGKPVEINALWYNALKVMEGLAARFGYDPGPYADTAALVCESFNRKFWNPDKRCLYDVVTDGSPDAKIRPNQIWAVSLAHTMLSAEKARAVVENVMADLYAVYGLRSLSPHDAEYKGIYKGALSVRDAAYHQGTAWGFPLGGLITAYVKVNNHSLDSLLFARQLLECVEDHLRDGCVGQIAEIFDGDQPHISRGCYAQAWSVGEILRAYTGDVLLPLRALEEP